MVPVSNERFIRSRAEKGHYSNGTSVIRPKWKPRRVSAIRDFPRGCEPIVQPIIVVSCEADAPSSLVNNNGVDVGGVSDVGTAQTPIESLSCYLPKSTQDGEVGLVVKPHKVEMEGLVNKELQNGDNQVVVEEKVGDPINAVVQAGDVKPMSPPQGSLNVNKGIVPKRKFPRKRVSAIRDFPPYCGLNALGPTEEERIRISGKRSCGAEDKGVGNNVGSTESMEGDKEPSRNVKNDFAQKTQSDELSNKSPMGNQETCVTATDLSMTGLMEDKVCSGDERSTERLIMRGEEPDVVIRDEKVQKFEEDATSVEPRSKLHRELQNDAKAIIDQVCRDIIVYSRENALKARSSDDSSGKASEPKLQEESVKNSISQQMIAVPEDISFALIEKDKKNISGKPRKVGHEKHIKKRPLDDTDDLGRKREEKLQVIGLAAPSFSPLRSVVQEPTTQGGTSRSTSKKPASKTPKKSKKKNAAYVENTAGEELIVPYTGTLEMVVRDEEDFLVHTEEQREDSLTPQGPHDVDVTLPPFGPKSSSDVRNQVRETLRLYQAICRKLLQGEEAKTKEGDESKSGQSRKRIDLAAIRILKEKGKELDIGKKRLGSVPGVEVGDEFQYRVELALVGIHRPYQAGIDYMKQGKDIVAVSIVSSGGYNDELDNPDSLIYSGSGGMGRDKQVENQKLERGNLALKNSIYKNYPVRVIRGYKEKAPESSDSKSKAVITTYIYYGLYTVDRYWQEPGPQGNLVFKYELKRIPGQPELAARQVKQSKKFMIREGVCVDDITGGKEVSRICAVNTINDEKPPPFSYVTNMIYPDWYRPVPPKGCDCIGRCSDKRCSCAFKNGGEIPYNHNGAIVEAKPLVYECGPSCKCPPTCYNRVTQHGMKIQLEIFKTESRGWGVRSLSSIPSGSFICEYIGELLEDTEAEKRTGNDEYLFDIGQNYNDCSVNPDEKPSSSDVCGFTIDAAYYGNVGRFINHSCSPNLYAQNVLYDQEDKRMPHIMLFAAENIPPLQELTYHYNYAVNTVHDSDGNIKIKKCYCGSSECTGRLY